MKKKWIQFTVFAIIACFLFGLLNSAASMANQGWKDFYKLPRNTLDIVYMGNSHNYQTFQPQIVDDLLSTNSYVLGTSGENIVVSYFELKELLKYQKPKAVLLETFTLDFADVIVPVFIYQFIDANRIDFNRLKLQLKYYPLNELYNYFPILRLRIDWNNPKSFTEGFKSYLFQSNSEIDSKRGFITNYLVITPDKYQEARTKPSTASDYSNEKNLVYLDKFVTLCKENDIELFFSVVPPLSVSGEAFKYYVPFDYQSYATEKNIKVLRVDTSNFIDLDYYDATHVSIFGSVLSSVQIAEKISEQMGLAIDEKKLNNYQAYTFSEYSISNSGNSFSFSILPIDQKVPFEYQYFIKRSTTDNEDYSSNQEGSNRILFEVPSPGEYIIEAKIRNLESDYVLTGIFPFAYMEEENN